MEYRPKRIKVEVLPYDDCDVDALIGELEKREFVKRYRASDCDYLQVLKFARHQNPHCKEPASTIPAPDWHDTSTENSGTSRADSLNLIPSSTTSSITDSRAEEEADFIPWTATERKAAIDALTACGLGRAIAVANEAERARMSLQGVLGLVAEFNANRTKFASAGAIAERIRHGAWPVVGVKPAGQVAVFVEEKKKRDALKKARDEIGRVVIAGRREKVSEDVIRERVRAAVGVEVAKSEGW